MHDVSKILNPSREVVICSKFSYPNSFFEINHSKQIMRFDCFISKWLFKTPSNYRIPNTYLFSSIKCLFLHIQKNQIKSDKMIKIILFVFSICLIFFKTLLSNKIFCFFLLNNKTINVAAFHNNTRDAFLHHIFIFFNFVLPQYILFF